MATKRNTSLDRVLGRLDQLDTINLTNLVQRLARERGLFEDIFNVLQEGVLVIDMEGVIAYANAAAQRLIGLGAEDELAGQTLWRMVPGLRPSLGALMEDDAALPVMAREFELTYPEPRVVRLYMVPFKSEAKKGGGRRFAVILTDVTRDRESTEKRIENERTSSVLLLAASVAHELGNPLNSLTIHLQLMDRRIKKLRLAAKDKDATALAESVAVCQAEVQRLDGIISNFLEAIRPSPPNLVESDLAEILADVLRFQQNELADRGIQVEAETQAQLPIVMADRNQVKQVFFNIIKNAMEAMSPGAGCASRRRRTTTMSPWRLATTAAASNKRTWCACSNPTTPPNPVVMAWG
jgi:two-component system, sporulation sensor kinase E